MLLISNALLILARDRQIDILFANAGTGEFGPLGAITEEHFDKTFNGNVKGLLFSVQKALPLLKDGSSIILNASIDSSTGSPALSVSKAAVRSFARTFTSDLKRPQNPCEGCESWRDSFSGLPQFPRPD
jgi:NAD(P)-dependent dehydrogenase (short-subunit alcohol dehydrogenase family)